MMAITTKTSPDKIKLLDQMLEDIAGDEFDEFQTEGNNAKSSMMSYGLEEDMDFFDTTH